MYPKIQMASTPREEPTNVSEVSPQRAPAPGLIFLLTDLHLAEGFDANFTELELESDDPADPFDDIHATYAAPLNLILESPINKAHMVLAVHVNSENIPGCYEIHGDAEVPIGLNGFKKLWLELHQSGRVLKQGTEAVVWHKNRAVTSLMEGLPANSRKIGVLSGKGRGAPLDDYISAAPNDQTLVFVVGKMDQIENYIDEYVEGNANEEIGQFLDRLGFFKSVKTVGILWRMVILRARKSFTISAGSFY